MSSLLLLLCLPVAAGEHIERRVGAMGTTLAVSVEALDRATALDASEVAVRAIEDAERRLSTWRDDSELSRLNRAGVAERVELSRGTAADLATALHWVEATGGAFDPAIGALVDAWGLRGEGRIPNDDEVRAARVPGGLVAALALDDQRAARRVSNLRIEEGAFGKGAGLDAALTALAPVLERSTARVVLDFGGHVAVCGVGEPFTIDVADPRERARAVVRWSFLSGSISTSGNSEHSREVGGVRIGHILDPRTGRPAPDFGSVSVWASSATAADCLSTAMFVLGPDGALAWANEHRDVEVLVLEPQGQRVRARATAGLRERVTALTPDVELTFVLPTSAHTALDVQRPSQPHSPESNP